MCAVSLCVNVDTGKELRFVSCLGGHAASPSRSENEAPFAYVLKSSAVSREPISP